MAMVLNMDAPPRVYHGKEDYEPTDRDFMENSQSGMSKELEDSYVDIKAGALQVLRKKKVSYHWNTKNKSFLSLYNDLHKMGIKNNKFFLAIYDTDLLSIDPYSPILPVDLQLKIILECMINPWYFLREICRVPEDGMPIEIGGGTQYSIDRNNAACWYLYLNGIDHYQSKPRQRGKTVDCIARCNYAFHFGALATNMLFFNKDQQMAKLNLYRLKCQRDMLPRWMQMKTMVDDTGKVDRGQDSVTMMRNPVTGNTISVMARATSKEGGTKLGRGATAAIQYYDEFEFIPFNMDIIKAASFAYSRASENAKKNASLYGRIFSSTPADLDSRDGAAATEYIDKMFKWTDKNFDDPIEKIKRTIYGPKCNHVVFVEHDWKQLKCSMKWYEEQCGMVSFDEETIMREINLKRLHGSNLSPFKRSDIMYLINHKQSAIKQEDISQNFCPFFFYEKLNRNVPYIVSIDPSEGLSQDNNACVFINPYTQKPAVEFKSPYISQPEFCDMLCNFMDRYCPKCMIIVENNRGREILNCFLKSRYQYQLYYDDGKLQQSPVDTSDEYGNLRQKAYERSVYGFHTSRNRSQLYQILENLVEERKDILISEFLIDDICGLIRKPNGRVEAGPGKHDDIVMAYLIGMYVYYNADPAFLESFGIVRGATSPTDDYNEDGTLTDEAKTRAIKAMMPDLPPELQELFQSVIKEKSEADVINERHKEIVQYQQLHGPIPSQMGYYDKMRQAQGIGRSPDFADQDFWKHFDDQVTESNFETHYDVDIDQFMGDY